MIRADYTTKNRERKVFIWQGKENETRTEQNTIQSVLVSGYEEAVKIATVHKAILWNF